MIHFSSFVPHFSNLYHAHGLVLHTYKLKVIINDVSDPYIKLKLRNAALELINIKSMDR